MEAAARTPRPSCSPSSSSENNPTLLVVDNCEQLLDRAADLLAELVARCPDLHVVVTSREHLGLDHERVWPLEGLALPAGGQDPRAAG